MRSIKALGVAALFLATLLLLPAHRTTAASGGQPPQFSAQATDLAAEAQGLSDAGQHDAADKKAREALALDASNAKAKEVLGAIERGKERARRRAAQAEVTEAGALMQRGQYAEAVARLESALKHTPDNKEATRLLTQARAKLADAEKATAAQREKLKQQRIRELVAQGMAAYRKNDVEGAAAKWREVLLLDPANERATTYLREIGEELARFEAGKREREQRVQAEAEAQRILDEKITIEVKEGTRLREFLQTLSFVTGINFVIVHGSDMTVAAKFEDKRLRDILDSVLLPNGLAWTRDRDIVTVVPRLDTRFFHLNSDTLLGVQRLFETKDLQRMLWHADQPALQGVDMRLDERQSALIVTDSPENLRKMEAFLGELSRKPPPKLITRIYTVRSDIADNIKVLVEATLGVETEPVTALERRVVLAKHERGADLILRDTEENLRKVELLLEDRDYLRRLEEEELEVYTVNLTPRDVLTANPEQVEAFGRDVKEVVETMLYHKDGLEAAMLQGRRMWYDPAALQMTITDYEPNIRKVAEFIQALPQLEPKMRSKIIFLEYQLAGDLASQLEEVLGIGAGPTGGAATGNEASFSMRVEDEKTFRDLSIRLVRVDENDYVDDNDDSCEMVVRTGSAASSDLSITEYRSEQFEEYEILVEEVDPSPTPGEGRVRLRVTYRPELNGGGTSY